MLLAVQQGAAPAPAAMLLNIKGIGPEFAAILWSEGLFRHFDNRRQVASYAGLAPTPWQSGSVDREQGVSKAGNPRLRTTLIQLAWLWLRKSAAIGAGSVVQEGAGQPQWRPSQRETTIVALARKLLVALWKYVTAGVVIEECHCEERLKGDRKKIEVIYRDPIESRRIRGGRTEPVRGLKSRYQEWSRPPEPRPPQAGYWCSRFARRPNVRLIWCGNDQIWKRAQTLDTETATGVSLMCATESQRLNLQPP